QVAVEEARARDVARLEEAGQRGQPREALGVGIRPPDEREDLELALEVRAVVGDHVHEVVLRKVRGRAAGCPGQREAAAVVHLPYQAAERILREVLERGP